MSTFYFHITYSNFLITNSSMIQFSFCDTPSFYHGRIATIGVGRIKAERWAARAPFAHRQSRAQHHDPSHTNYVASTRRFPPAGARATWRGTRLQNIPVQKSDEAHAREEEEGSHQQMPRRTQRLDGHRSTSRRRKCIQIGKSRHPRTHSPTSTQPEKKRTTGAETWNVVCRTFSCRFYAMCYGSISVYCKRNPRGQRDAAPGTGGPSSRSEVASTLDKLHQKIGKHSGRSATAAPTSASTSTSASKRHCAASAAAAGGGPAGAAGTAAGTDAAHAEDHGPGADAEAARGTHGRGSGARKAGVRAAFPAAQPRLRDRLRPIDVATVVTLCRRCFSWSRMLNDRVTSVIIVTCCLFSLNVPRTDVC